MRSGRKTNRLFGLLLPSHFLRLTFYWVTERRGVGYRRGHVPITPRTTVQFLDETADVDSVVSLVEIVPLTQQIRQ